VKISESDTELAGQETSQMPSGMDPQKWFLEEFQLKKSAHCKTREGPACMGCGRFMYCGKEHQTLLWKDEHNFVCLKTHKLSKKRGCKGVPS